MLFNSPRQAKIHSHNYYSEGWIYGFIEQSGYLWIIVEHSSGDVELLQSPPYSIVFLESSVKRC